MLRNFANGKILMNVLYISLYFPLPGKSSNIYSDLMEEFARHGHLLHIVTIDERKNGRITRVSKEAAGTVLRVRTGNIFNVGVLEKGLSLIALPGLLKRAMAKHLPGCRYDLILYATPPVTFARIIESVKQSHPWAKSYLMLKDIFPQNAKDLGMIRNFLIFRYFKRQERRLYAASDVIGCMSEANVAFLLCQNPEVPSSRVEILPNTCTPGLDIGLTQPGPHRDKYHIPKKAVVVLWGGNMGKPQGMDFIVEIIDANRNRKDVHFLLVGDGTERARIVQQIKAKDLVNATVLETLPRNEYSALARECDIGLICLDRRFTIPNFPSRLLSYLDIRMPILAALDSATDFGLMLEKTQAGLWSLAGDRAAFQRNLDRLVSDPELRRRMGECGRHYLETHFTSSHAYQIISRHISTDRP
jgi:glycosyltransferase involved in cell wall biosynthesis